MIGSPLNSKKEKTISNSLQKIKELGIGISPKFTLIVAACICGMGTGVFMFTKSLRSEPPALQILEESISPEGITRLAKNPNEETWKSLGVKPPKMDPPKPKKPKTEFSVYQAGGLVQTSQPQVQTQNTEGPPRSEWENLLEGTEQEYFYNTGEWIPAIEEAIEYYLDMPSWRDTSSFKLPALDITTTRIGAEIATTISSLKDRLDPKLVARTKERLKKEVINPFLDDYGVYQQGVVQWKENRCGWMELESKWVLVCTANIVYTAALTLDDPKEIAKVVAIGKELMDVYFKNLDSSSIISAGIRDWALGYKHLVLLSESLLHITKGKTDLYKNPKMQSLSVLPLVWEYQGKEKFKEAGFYPMFGDNNIYQYREPVIEEILNARYNLNFPPMDTSTWDKTTINENRFLNIWSDYKNIQIPQKTIDVEGLKRQLLEQGQAVLTYNLDNTIALAVKAGNLAETLNHNDLGSYILSKHQGDQWYYLSGDTGVLTYGPGHFGENRFQIDVVSSWGHPVPIVDNQLQIQRNESQATISKQVETQDLLFMEMDLTRAYAVNGLSSLTRLLLWDKKNSVLHIRDKMKGKRPMSFSTTILSPATEGPIFVAKGSGSITAIPSIAKSGGGEEFQRLSLSLLKDEEENWIEYAIFPNEETKARDRGVDMLQAAGELLPRLEDHPNDTWVEGIVEINPKETIPVKIRINQEKTPPLSEPQVEVIVGKKPEEKIILSSTPFVVDTEGVINAIKGDNNTSKVPNKLNPKIENSSVKEEGYKTIYSTVISGPIKESKNLLETKMTITSEKASGAGSIGGDSGMGLMGVTKIQRWRQPSVASIKLNIKPPYKLTPEGVFKPYKDFGVWVECSNQSSIKELQPGVVEISSDQPSQRTTIGYTVKVLQPREQSLLEKYKREYQSN